MTQRHLRNALVALALLTLSAACSRGPATAPRAHRALSSPTPTTTARPRPLRRHQLSFDEQMRAIRFADQTHGLLLHRQCSARACRTVVHATADGGAHWHQQGSIPFAAPRVNLLIANRLDAVAGFSRLFGDPWRPDRAAYATTDGGRHWRSLALPSHSAIAAIAPRRILVTQNKCNRNGTRCAVGIFAAPRRARHFSRISTPPTGGLPIAGLVSSGTTVYISAGSWWAGESKVLVSTDAGASWRTAPSPCSSPGGWSVSLSALPGKARTVWALCFGQPAAGTQEKELAISSDAGLSWVTRPDPSVGGYGTDISVTSKADAWQFEENRADVMSTTNAGRSWRDTLQGRVGESAGGSTYWFDPLSTDDAWVISLDAHQRSLFLRTTDAGRHWQRLRLPF